jgi:membrane-associated protease RseP (regulator of RpoE activity)
MLTVAALVVGIAASLLTNIGVRRACARMPWPAGVTLAAAASWLVASIAFTAALLTGFDVVPDETSMRVHVEPGGPAAEAGLLDGDRIMAVDYTAVHDWESLKREVSKAGDEPIALQVQRGAEWIVVPVTPKGGMIRVMPPVTREPVPFGRATSAGLVMPARLYALTIGGLFRTVAASPEGEATGPVGIVRRSQSEGRPPIAAFLGGAAIFAAYGWPLVAVYGLLMALRARSRAAKPA